MVTISRRAIYLFALLACIPAMLASKQPQPEEKEMSFDEAAYTWARTFAEVMQLTNQKHFNVANPQDSMLKAIDAFLSNLDPHSNFLEPKIYKSILEATTGEFFGIGIVIDNTRQAKDKFLLVIDTIPDGPADKAGVKALDKLVEIDGKPLEGMTTEEATSMLKGERNTKVHIKVMRENYPDIISLDIKRDEIKEQASLCYYLPKHDIYYLSLTTFSDNSVQQVSKLLHQLKDKNHKGLILDLRNNSGGLLTAAIDIASLFLDKESLVVITKSKGNKEVERYATSKAPVFTSSVPIFVLINNYTASAAEILAGCLKVHSERLAQAAHKKTQKKLMVFLVGTRTFGKGSVQEVIPVSNNCAIKITTSLYYLPNDVSIQGLGIEPDFILEKRFPPTEQMIWFNKFYGRERALSNYIKSDKQADEKEKLKDEQKEKKSSKEKNWSERARDMLDKDSQVRDTLSLINMFATAQQHCPDLVSNRLKAVDFLKHMYTTDESLELQEIKF